MTVTNRLTVSDRLRELNSHALEWMNMQYRNIFEPLCQRTSMASACWLTQKREGAGGRA